MEKIKTAAIIPAAGAGKRIKSNIKKPYLILDNKPILVHTIQAIIRPGLVDSIVVVVAPGDRQYCIEKIIKPYNFQTHIDLVEGGKTRQESVFNGLQLVSKDCDIVLIHDSVRPFVDSELIERLLTAAEQFGAATAAVPVKDTIKIADEDGFVLDTPARKNLWATQTPQTFRYEIIKKAYQKVKNMSSDEVKDTTKATDDAALVEQLGYKVKIIKGNYQNIKITTPEDLEFARFLINQKRQEGKGAKGLTLSL